MELYQELKEAKNIDERRQIINDYFKSNDITQFLSEGELLSEEKQLDINKKIEKLKYMPFIVGQKYELDEPYDSKKNLIYLLAIIDKSKDKHFLIVDEESKILSLPENRVEPIIVQTE